MKSNVELHEIFLLTSEKNVEYILKYDSQKPFPTRNVFNITEPERKENIPHYIVCDTYSEARV